MPSKIEKCCSVFELFAKKMIFKNRQILQKNVRFHYKNVLSIFNNGNAQFCVCVECAEDHFGLDLA